MENALLPVTERPVNEFHASLSFKHISFFTICCYNHKLKESVQESFIENGGKIHQYSGYARAFDHINCH